MPGLTISPSKIQAADCPFYFRSQYYGNDPGAKKSESAETPINLLTGRLRHACIDLYTRLLKERGLTADHELFDAIYAELWKKVPYLPESMYDTVRGSMLAFVEGYSVDAATLWASERRVSLTWDLEECEWDDPSCWVRSVFDRINVYPGDSTVEITDYKSSMYLPSEANLQKSLQSKIYPFIMHSLNPYFERFIMTFHFIPWNAKVSIVYDGLDLENHFAKVEKELRDFTVRMQAKIDNPDTEWVALRGENCGICRYKCPLEDAGIKIVRTHEDAVQTAMEYQATVAKAKRLKENLQAYSKGTDSPIEVHDGRWSYRPLEVLKGIKPHHIIDYGQEKGIPVDDLPLKFDSDAYKKTAGPEMRAAIETYGKKSLQSRFGFTKTATTGEEDEE